VFAFIFIEMSEMGFNDSYLALLVKSNVVNSRKRTSSFVSLVSLVSTISFFPSAVSDKEERHEWDLNDVDNILQSFFFLVNSAQVCLLIHSFDADLCNVENDGKLLGQAE